jgi:hypothetical protein
MECVFIMEDRSVYVQIFDDYMDNYEESKREYRRECIYYSSAIATIGLMIGLLIWTYIILEELDANRGH